MVSIPPALLRAHQPASGARFRRVALQVNPWRYVVAQGKPTTCADEDEYNQLLVERLLAERIEAIAVTDHNCATSGAGLISAATRVGIAGFPGFEISSKEGIHLLCLFDPSRTVAEVEEVLLSLDVGANGLAGLHLDGLLQRVVGRGGLCVAPHVTTGGGLLHVLKGEARIAAWSRDELIAVAIQGRVDDEEATMMRMLTGSEVAFRRSHMPAIINANDVWDPSHVSRFGSWTNLKMSGCTIDGVRHAFLDPDSRVRLSDTTLEGSHSYLEAICWQGGFFSDLVLPLVDGLNVIIGGRGAGKSGVVRSIRYLLGVDPLTEEVTRDHQQFVRSVLRESVVWGLARSRFPASATYVLRRSFGSPPEVFSSEGHLLDLTPSDLGLGVEIYGQHELAYVAQDQRQQIALVRRYLPVTDPSDEVRAIASEIADHREELEALEDRVQKNAMRLAELPSKVELLRRYRESGLEARLGRSVIIDRESRVPAGPTKLVARAVTIAQALADQLKPIPTVDVTSLDASPTGVHLAPLGEAVDALVSEVASAASLIDAAAMRLDAMVRDAIAKGPSE